MTGALLGAIYLVALGCFLGLDILGKIPATLYALVLAAVGATLAVAFIGPLYLLGGAFPSRSEGGLPGVALVLASAAAGGGVVAVSRLVGAYKRR